MSKKRNYVLWLLVFGLLVVCGVTFVGTAPIPP